MNRNLSKVLDQSRSDMNCAECRRNLEVAESDLDAATTSKELSQAAEDRLTTSVKAAIKAAINENTLPTGHAPDTPSSAHGTSATVLKAKPGDSPLLCRQGLQRELIFNDRNTPDTPLSLERVSLQMGEESTPHAHVGTHTMVYTLTGRVRLYYGDELENSMEVGPEDCVFIPPGVIHHVVNEHEEPMTAIVARTAPRHDVIEYPHLRDRVLAAATL